jgi:hypothetical protein
MTRQPGMPIRIEQDEAEWRAWRRERIMIAQRDRRAGMRRIINCEHTERAGTPAQS